jgi:murein DD-endopeptidase MepM/ murein hydrolase activator NlpD
MTRTFTIRASLIALSTLSLAACETPNYPTHTSSPVATPTPTPAPATPQPAPAPPPAEPPAPATPQAAPPTAQVESQPLPPITSPPPAYAPPPATVSPSSPAQGALPPDYTPPSPTPVEPAPTPEPPPVRYHTTPERVVAGGPVVAAHGMYRDYVVQPKDHVDAIARDLQTTRKVLVEANHLKAPYALKPGEHLKVPVAKAYEVQAGDTMTEIAKRFGVSVGELSDLNDLPVKARLRPGDAVALPDGYHDHGPTRLPGVEVAEREPGSIAPTRSWGPPARRSQPSMEATGAPYTPSPEALAAAQRLAAERAYTPPSATARSTATAATAETSGPAQPPTGAQLAVASAGRGRFIWPVKGEVISPFGLKGLGRRNDGIDVRSPQGSDVRASAAGDVVYAGDQVPGFGNLVLVKHADGWVTAYAHLQSIGVQMRQTVMQGQTLGAVGSTGGVAEPELHFEIRYAATPSEKAKPVDPLLVLPKQVAAP